LTCVTWLWAARSYWAAGFSQKPAKSSSWRYNMDYMIAGIASAGLLVYLIFALLKPERF